MSWHRCQTWKQVWSPTHFGCFSKLVWAGAVRAICNCFSTMTPKLSVWQTLVLIGKFLPQHVAGSLLVAATRPHIFQSLCYGFKVSGPHACYICLSHCFLLVILKYFSKRLLSRSGWLGVVLIFIVLCIFVVWFLDIPAVCKMFWSF